MLILVYPFLLPVVIAVLIVIATMFIKDGFVDDVFLGGGRGKVGFYIKARGKLKRLGLGLVR
jgi:hypothetical protein